MDLTAVIVISSTNARLAAMKFSTAAANGKSAVIWKVISLRNLKMSTANHVWNPSDMSAAIIATRAWRNGVLKLAVAATCAVISIMSIARYGSFSRYPIASSSPPGPMMVAKLQKNKDRIRAVDMPRCRVWRFFHIVIGIIGSAKVGNFIGKSYL